MRRGCSLTRFSIPRSSHDVCVCLRLGRKVSVIRCVLQASFVFLRHCFVKLETIRRENKVHLGFCRCNVSGFRKHMINYFELLARLKVGRLSVCQSLYLIFLIFWILAVIVCHWNLANLWTLSSWSVFLWLINDCPF